MAVCTLEFIENILIVMQTKCKIMLCSIQSINVCRVDKKQQQRKCVTYMSMAIAIIAEKASSYSYLFSYICMHACGFNTET